MDITLAKVEKAGKESWQPLYVTGAVLVPDLVDHQKEWLSAETIRQVAYSYLERYNIETGTKFSHAEQINDKVTVVESYIAPADLMVEKTLIPAGSWVMTMKIYDRDLRLLVESGGITGFSIGAETVQTYGEPSDE